MNQEAKQCQNCKQDFVIEPDDFAFYEKIKVPPPTFCPECRLKRRLMWRNELSFYRRKCDAPGHDEQFISYFHPDTELTIFDYKYWWSGDWDPLDYGMDYAWDRPFFDQFRELISNVPWYNLRIVDSINCEYSEAFHSKNCYLGSVYGSEDCLYADVGFSKNSVDINQSLSLENCYECSYDNKNFKVFFSDHTLNSLESNFLSSCNNLQHCSFCVNLKNKKHHFFNVPYTKEEYEKKLKELDLGSFASLERLKKEFLEFKLKFPHKYSRNINTVDSLGDGLKNAKNCFYCFNAADDVENCKYVLGGGVGLRNSYDTSNCGVHSESFYEMLGSGENGNNNQFSVNVLTSHSVRYSIECHGSSNLFGCFGLKNKKYCILNKQYSKEEYEMLIPEIIKNMNDMPYADKKGRIYKYGEFFPIEISPFAYNETITQRHFPLVKEEAEALGYEWRDTDIKQYSITKYRKDLPDHIKDTGDDVLKEIIGCSHEGNCVYQCATAFRIIPEELSFYRRMNISLPELCSNCRYYERLKNQNPAMLWHRACQCSGQKSENGVYQNTGKHQHGEGQCPNEFETSYSPERKEIVYCESCYNAEVV